MPNYKLGSNIKADIEREANTLMSRRFDTMRQGFPLNVERLQETIIEPDLLAQMRSLYHQGVRTITKTQTIYIAITPAQFETSKYLAILELRLPKEIYTKRPTGYVSTLEAFGKVVDACQELTGLTTDERAALATWSNAVINERRYGVIVGKAVADALEVFTTVAEVQATWPMLGTLIKDEAQKIRAVAGKMPIANDWRSKFRNVPKDIQRWNASAKLPMKLLERMPLFDSLLTQAQMLPPVGFNGKVEVIGSLHRWEKPK